MLVVEPLVVTVVDAEGVFEWRDVPDDMRALLPVFPRMALLTEGTLNRIICIIERALSDAYDPVEAPVVWLEFKTLPVCAAPKSALQNDSQRSCFFSVSRPT